MVDFYGGLCFLPIEYEKLMTEKKKKKNCMNVYIGKFIYINAKLVKSS